MSTKIVAAGKVVVEERKKRLPPEFPPFEAMTGNPENGNYADYIQYMEEKRRWDKKHTPKT